jgi:UDP-N-acetyl-D-mannosaminuronic acid dehydrogenase
MNENNITDLSKVGLYGLTYKENVDDVRESPTLQLLEKLEKYFVKGIRVYDPMLKTNRVAGQTQDFDEFINNVDIVVVLVGHSHIHENMSVLKDKIVIDTRNIISDAGKLYKL